MKENKDVHTVFNSEKRRGEERYDDISNSKLIPYER